MVEELHWCKKKDGEIEPWKIKIMDCPGGTLFPNPCMHYTKKKLVN
jgi:hypothetical protein